MIRQLFAKKPTPTPLQMLEGRWQCSCCGEWHEGLMDLAAGAPDHWPHEQAYEPNSALRTDGDFLSEDFCVLEGRHFFVRSVLVVPIQASERGWGFGAWTTLSRENFDRYAAMFDDPPQTDEVWFGWLSNKLRIYHQGSEPVSVDVYPQSNRQRPRLFVQDGTHPLAVAQREGITPEDLLILLRAYGHGPTLQ